MSISIINERLYYSLVIDNTQVKLSDIYCCPKLYSITMVNEFAQPLLQWAEVYGRRDLPWQKDRDPYHIWVSEVMLQQTRVDTVIPYFQKFMARFPDICTLSIASLDEVLAYWSGLGYYARARNLHRAASVLCNEQGGSLPMDRLVLETLPGIGRSTAAAILSLAYDLPEPILDGNVKRVLSRYYEIEGWSGSGSVLRQLWQCAEKSMPVSSCGAYTQAIMDLGASLCTRSKPQCEHCPLMAECMAQIKGRTDELPSPRPSKKLPLRKNYMAILHHPKESMVLLQRRAENGIWGGLWSFPEFEGEQENGEWLQLIEDKQLPNPELWNDIIHTFTHFRLQITPLYFELDHQLEIEHKGVEWVALNRLHEHGQPAPVKKLMKQLQQEKNV